MDYQITPKDLATVLSSPLFTEVHGVGINGGEPTLRADLAELVEILFQYLPKLASISLITNALKSDQVIQRIQEVGQVVKSYGGRLDVMVSLDGVGVVHDRVRGRSGNFEHAVKVIDFIQQSEIVSSRRLGCTVIKENVYGIHDLLEFAIQKNIYIKYRIGIPHQRLYSKNTTEPFSLNFDERYHFAIFLENLNKYYETSVQQKFFYRSLIGQLVKDEPRIAGCDWQHRGVTLSARGELLYCAVESKTLGSAITQDPVQLYRENEPHLHDIVLSKCHACMHDYAGLLPFKYLVSSYIQKILNKNKLQLKNFIKHHPLLQNQLPLLSWLRFIKRTGSLYGKSIFSVSRTTYQPATQFPQTSRSPKRVLICGWYGTETLGDKAILGGVVHALKDSLGDIEIHLVTLQYYISKMTILQMPELHDCLIHNVQEALSIIESMDLLVFGGGPLMKVAQITDMLALFRKAAEKKIPSIIAGCGVGPLGYRYHNEAIKEILQLATHRIYRDEESLQYARLLGINTSKDQVAEDPAFTWLDKASQEMSSTVSSLQYPTLLLGLRNWTYSEYAHYWKKEQGEQIKIQFEREILLALDDILTKNPNLTIIPFPMCTNHIGNDDRWFYRYLFRNHPNLSKSIDFTYLRGEISPSEAVKVFQSATAVIAMRFHSLVFSLASNVPVLSVDYTLGQGKTKALAEKYQIPHMSIDTINKDFIMSTLMSYFNNQHKKQTCNLDRLKFSDSIQLCIKRLS
jgi:polysaccharide pyruvyl transferase WcaK-like protein/sulfatase maturation enzyme AslB (radical SAM superfamily)